MTEAYDLVAEARSRFGELSEAEAKLLRSALSGEVAYCGPSDKDDDPANDPANAAQWGTERTIRAKLIRWLCIDREASQRIDPRGVNVHASGIGGSDEKDLNLSSVRVLFPLRFLFCNFELPLNLTGAKLISLNLGGTRIPRLPADGVSVEGSVMLRYGFHVEGEVRLLGAHIDGDLDCRGANFVNKGGIALNADGMKVTGNVFLADKMNVEGEVRLPGAKIDGYLVGSGTQFGDASSLNLEKATVNQAFLWTGLGPNSPVTLNLAHASIGPMADDEQSWPKKGNLLLDGFTYERIGEGPTSAEKRLEWLARQPQDKFRPQPYRQLAKVLREAGDDSGARKVLIAMENARLKHGNLSIGQRLKQWLLRLTVGYGYVPLRALWYIVFFVILGTFMFGWGSAAGVITRVEKKYGPEQAEPFNPFIYSVETFLPGVDLRMAKYWMPNPWQQPIALAWPFSESLAPTPHYLGAYLRWYLWVHILCGWFFILIFVAGITGLVRRE